MIVKKLKEIVKYEYGKFVLFTSICLLIGIGLLTTMDVFDPLSIALVLFIAILWMIGYIGYVHERDQKDDKE